MKRCIDCQHLYFTQMGWNFSYDCLVVKAEIFNPDRGTPNDNQCEHFKKRRDKRDSEL